MVKGKCSKHFPKRFIDRLSFDEDGYARYRRKDSGNVVIKNGVEFDNHFVVPYNPTLLLRYQMHINVEFCNQTRSIKYLFKYVSKRHDKVTSAICKEKSSEGDEYRDEIKQYYDCRYVSPCEVAWRIFGFDINFREPAVERLPFHLPNRQGIVFPDDDPIDDVVGNASLKQTKFLAWLEANKIHATVRELTYAQFPTKFVFKTDTREWYPRKAGYAIGRLYYVPLGLGELHYLRVLLHEASKWSSRVYLRNLFSTLLIHNTIAIPSAVWEQTWMHLSDDILIKERHRLCNPDLVLDDDRVKDIALAEIEKILRSNGRSLRDFPPMPLPNDAMMSNTDNALMSEELNYDRNILRTQHSQFVSSLTAEQRNVYDSIMDVVYRSEGGLIPGSRTAHSRFAIPLDCNENSTCNIMQGSDIANLMVHTKLIIWDEAPIAHRYCFEALDRSLRDIMGNNNPECDTKPFGGNFDSENRSICKFVDWILQIGDGLIGDMVNDEESEIIVSSDILISNVQDPVEAIVENTYPSFQQKYDDHEYIRDREILAPTLDDVAVINNYMLSLLLGEEGLYLSSDIAYVVKTRILS
ncbi:ATP-dependent DNA helicase pif1 [Senna tora]|uniref:ATP-dependent DNA helicase n=1 Tax=Senna tora TaxID=362788 RepID=A0A835C9I6_9FABA|nr:ATP-dependent DNA helicase pif1 [Senna tora]